MKNKKLIILFVLILGLSYYFYSYKITSIIIGIEFLSYFYVGYLRKKSPIIITPKDQKPELSWNGLFKFFKSGYDPELGWVRIPNTSKKEIGKDKITSYSIDEKGSRNNPEHKKLPKKISCYGDSFTFSRQVNDNETWEYFLSKHTKSNVLNFGVGNYGLDQSILRLKREYPKNKTKIVIMGVVPSTIFRNLSVWKHYHEFGNTFGFKPIFIIKNKKLELIKNPINSEDKFLYYEQYLNKIRKYDYFYKRKFLSQMISFPYSISLITNPIQNIPSIIIATSELFGKKIASKTLNIFRSLKLRFIQHPSAPLYQYKYATKLMDLLIEDFIQYSRQQGFTPILLFMPQKEDLISAKYKGNYYKDFIKQINKKIKTIDVTKLINSRDLDRVYTDDSKYGGHFSKFGNKLVANEIYKNLLEWKLI